MLQKKHLSGKKNIYEISAFYKKRFGYKHSHISKEVNSETKLIIVIPIYNEPNIIDVLESLKECDLPDHPIEVILVINNSEDGHSLSVKQNKNTQKEILTWINYNSKIELCFHLLIENNLPAKHAGVGLARKIGMDEALYRFGRNGNDGLIICLDADCKVATNYLTTIANQLNSNQFTSGHLYFEHPTEDQTLNIRTGIINYELGLRYYVYALKHINYPFAYHTIGSCMLISAKTYALSGGMNKRKAGEDFYFLHKIFPAGGHKVINTTCVYPSPRISKRVPFGTGRAMEKWNKEINEQRKSNKFPEYKYYALQSFLDLSQLLQVIPCFWKCTNQNSIENLLADLPKSVSGFLIKADYIKILEEIRSQTKTEKAFIKRFYGWFDGFKVLKYIHFCREYYYPDLPLKKESSLLLKNFKTSGNIPTSTEKLLNCFRELEKGH